MPNTKNNRRGTEAGRDQNRRGRLMEKASSFHGKSSVTTEETKQLRRPRTMSDLRSVVVSAQPAFAGTAAEERPRLTKLLLNVTLQGSLGPVHVIMTPDSSVGDLIAAAVRQYVKEGRRPVLPAADPARFDLHYSQFSLESLGRDEQLMSLGSRNFFLCVPKPAVSGADGAGAVVSGGSSCSKEAERATKTGFNWLKFMDFSL